jgi:hypothetical protein
MIVDHLASPACGDQRVQEQGSRPREHLTICEADVEQDGRSLVHAVATFAVLHK